MALHEEKVELLRKVDLFSPLREYELDIIAQHSELVEFGKGQAVFRRGEPAEDLYVVTRGRIGIISVESDDVAIAQLLPGESFGELDFIGRTPRTAAAFAEEQSVVLRFPASKYPLNTILHDHTYIAAQMLYRLLGIISERIWNVTRMLYEKTDWLRDLHKQLLCDKMTGLYNQTFLKEDFVNLLPDLGSGVALLMIKPDNFKTVNDTYGHETGDQVLNIMAIFLQSELDEKDIGVRYRGDEFAAILVDTDRDRAIQRAREISASFKNMDLSRVVGTEGLRILVSIGVALYPEGAKDSAELVETAHRKMLHARDAGGNRVSI